MNLREYEIWVIESRQNPTLVRDIDCEICQKIEIDFWRLRPEDYKILFCAFATYFTFCYIFYLWYLFYLLLHLLPSLTSFMSHTFHVENIKCWWCIKTIETSLLKQSWVTEVHIDKDTQTITISWDIDTSQISSYLTSLWYPAAGTGNLLNKAKSYVSCALGKLSS